MKNEETISDVIQRTAGTDYAARNGIEIAVEIWEQHTGRVWHKRKGVLEAMRMIEAGEADVIVLWKWNRLSRKRLHWAAAEEKVHQLGGSIESATEPVDVSTASGRFSRNVLVDLAEMQSDLIGESWMDTHNVRRSRGLPATGGKKFGYTWIRGQGERYEINPVEREPYAWLYDQYIDGAGRRTLMNALNTRGITNSQGRAWTITNVIQVLDSGFAAGLLSRMRYRNGRVWVPPFPERTWDQGAHEAIITMDTWERYRAARLQRPSTPARITAAAHSITGLIVCGHAEHGEERVTMVRRTHTGPNLKRPKAPTYVCGGWNRGTGATFVGVAERRVLEAVKHWLRDLVDDIERLADAAELSQTKRLRARTDITVAEGELADLERQLVHLTRQHITGVVPESAYLTLRDQLLAEQAKVEARLTTARLETGPALPPAELAGTLLADWDILPVARRRAMLAKLLTAITIYPAETRNGRARIAITSQWNT